MMDLENNGMGKYFHIELLKYYFNNQLVDDELDVKDEQWLYFDFDKKGIYTIQMKDLKEKAFEESILLHEKHGLKDAFLERFIKNNNN